MATCTSIDNDGNNITTLLNLGLQSSGNLIAPIESSLGAGVLPGSLALGDIDGDKKIDLTAAGSGNIYIERNSSTFSFYKIYHSIY